MPLKLSIGVSRKVGQPDFGSLGASCGLELELSEALLHSDLDAFHLQVRDAYVACQQAVDDELARLRARPGSIPLAAPAATSGEPEHRNGPAAHANGAQSRPNGVPPRAGAAKGRPAKPATAGQVKAIYAIARAQHADLEGLLRDEYGVARPEDLTLAEASKFIDQLKAAAEV